MTQEAESFAVQRSAYARTLRQWALAQDSASARHLLCRLADEQDRSVEILLNLPTEHNDEHTLH